MDLSSNVKFSIWVFFVILLAYTAGCWTTPGPRTYASPPNSHYTPRGGRGHKSDSYRSSCPVGTNNTDSTCSCENARYTGD